jgi:hypothetical protein
MQIRKQVIRCSCRTFRGFPSLEALAGPRPPDVGASCTWKNDTTTSCMQIAKVHTYKHFGLADTPSLCGTVVVRVRIDIDSSLP